MIAFTGTAAILNGEQKNKCTRTNIYQRNIVRMVQKWHPYMGTRSAAICLKTNDVPLHVALRVLVGRT